MRFQDNMLFKKMGGGGVSHTEDEDNDNSNVFPMQELGGQIGRSDWVRKPGHS